MRILLALLSVLLSAAVATAQQSSGFIFNAAGSISATTSSAAATLPGSGSKVLAQNTGTVTAFLAFGSAGIVATTSGMPLTGGACIYLQVTNFTTIAAITGSSTTAVTLTQGEGDPPISCGGGGSGGGGTVTGNVSNATSGVAPTSTNIGANSYMYGWNGATWDQAALYTAGTFGSPSTQVLSVQNLDPCSYATKLSAPISVATATTTSLVAVSGSTIVYVCGVSFTIAPSAVTADTALFEYGTGAACTSPTVLTGTYGNGDLTSAAPVVAVNYGGGSQTIFKSAASNGICILTAGTAVSVQGVITYVQQ